MKNTSLRLIFDSVSSVIKTATLKDTGVVFGATIASSVLGAAFYFSLARLAGPAGFGTFAAVMAVVITITDLFDIAINASIINFATRQENRAATLRFALLRKLGLITIASTILYLLSPLIVRMLSKPELLTSLRLAVLLIPSKSLYSYVRAALQATRQFVLDATIEIGSTIIRLGFFFGGILVFHSDPVVTAIIAYASGLIMATLIGIPVVKRMLVTSQLPKQIPGFTSYQSWMTLSFIVLALAGRLDMFYLTRLTSLAEVGWYQAAFRLFMPIQGLSSSLSRVFAPRFASFTSKAQVNTYLRKAILLSSGLAASMFITVPFLRWGIKILYGPEYSQTASLSYVLIWYFAVFLTATPWWSKLLYWRSNTRTYAILAIAHLVFLLVAFPLGIIIWGAIGAAAVLVASSVFGMGLAMIASK
jgi:O-antigen/teichoic acid export membrane protein